MENEEHIPDHKQIPKFLKRITKPEMGEGKYAITETPGPTFPTLEMVVSFLIHFVSQKNSVCIIALMDRGADRHGRGHKISRRF